MLACRWGVLNSEFFPYPIPLSSVGKLLEHSCPTASALNLSVASVVARFWTRVISAVPFGVFFPIQLLLVFVDYLPLWTTAVTRMIESIVDLCVASSLVIRSLPFCFTVRLMKTRNSSCLTIIILDARLIRKSYCRLSMGSVEFGSAT
jgi:hypothetical protein